MNISQKNKNLSNHMVLSQSLLYLSFTFCRIVRRKVTSYFYKYLSFLYSAMVC